MNPTKTSGTFLIQPRPVHVWSAVWHALAFSLTGTGGALYSYLVFTGIFDSGLNASVAVLALVLVSLGALIIFTRELTYRTVFLTYFLTNLGKSWISRGVLALIIFAVLNITSLLLERSGLGSAILSRALANVAALAALVVIVYPSLVLSTAAIPFWRSALLPLEFLVSSAIGGLAIIILWQLTGHVAIPLSALLAGLVSLLLINLVVHLIHLAFISSSTRRETIRLLTVGELRTPFLIGFFALGIGVPLALATGGYFVNELSQPPIVLLMAILVLLGIFFQRYSVLSAGIKPALL